VSWRDLVVLAAGFAAGGINAVVGSGTLIAFPVLVGFGYQPVVANVSNTIGLIPGSATGILGWRRELRGNVRLALELAAASGIGAVLGAELLLHLPRTTFRSIVAVIIGIAVVLVVAQPWVAKWVAEHRPDPARRVGPLTWLLVFVTGVYGGYFGAAQGVILLAILGVTLRESLRAVNAIRNVLAGTANLVAGVVFAALAPVNWRIALLIGVSSLAGGGRARTSAVACRRRCCAPSSSPSGRSRSSS
jgi:uncharacterized membrane protein YfcA